ncbi:MAG: 30S ribosomal protein S16 [Dehalococcoidia bacterium]|nr:30S ribosomal protein S16 [Dehalococcoidia bacterium]MCB9484689.1 30S ribosomal protein S16 [Thermoflexaceae bacterium]
MLKIRLTRIGKTKKPYYRLVVAEELGRRDGRFVETLGSYDPHADPPVAKLDAEKTREWITKGAQPSEAAAKILKRAGVIEAEAATK